MTKLSEKVEKSLNGAFGSNKVKEEQHEENGIRVETRKPQPKITKVEPSKYPLETIKIDRSQLTLNDAKEKILEDIELYNFTIQNIVNDKDYIQIGSNKHLCKSGVRKIQLALNISTEIISNEVWQDEKGQWIAKYKVRAITPTGRYTEAMGLCEQNEKGRSRTMMDTLATAQTRATNRAILDLVGFGRISEEEMETKPSKSLEAAFGGK